MKLVLHHCHDARSLRTAWLLEELGLPYQMIIHEFGQELQDPSYLAKSPAGRVPCLEMDFKPIIETGAITELLCEAFPNDLFRGPGDPQRADWLQWLHFAETIGQHLAVLTQQHIVLFPDTRSVGVMKLERRRLEKTLGVIEAAIEGQDYLLGNTFTAVDINVGYAVHIARLFTPLDAFPNVMAYHQRITARPVFLSLQPKPGDSRVYTEAFYDLP